MKLTRLNISRLKTPNITIPRNLSWFEIRGIVYRPVLNNLQTKKYWKAWIELSFNDSSKRPEIETLPQFPSMSGNNWGIYWLDSQNLLTTKNRAKINKQLEKVSLYISVLNTHQYKQFFCILTIPKSNA